MPLVATSLGTSFADSALVLAAEATNRRPAAEAKATSESLRAVARAELAFGLAGRALDANAEFGADLVLARKLLREGIECVARSFALRARSDIRELERDLDFDAAVELLEANGELARAGGSGASTILGALRAEAPSEVELGAVERLSRRLVDAARSRRTTLLHQRARRIGTVLVIVGTVLAVLGYSLRPWNSYEFRVSSAYEGYQSTGKLADAADRDLLFHTSEEDEPWVEIDLLARRKVHSVTLKNRADCCVERATPLVIELAAEDRSFRVVAQRDEPFDTWKADFPREPARYVRVRALRRTLLHLRAIEVR